MSSPCFTRELLLSFLEEQLPLEVQQQCAAHLEACPSCQSLIESLLAELTPPQRTSAVAAESLSENLREFLQTLKGHTFEKIVSEQHTLAMENAWGPPPPAERSADHTANEISSPNEHEAEPKIHDPLVGRWVGPYRLEKRLGQGGFGVVYLAVQEKPIRRRLAMKILLPELRSREVMRRFEAERQTLALMDHPHIAKLLDASSMDDGRPYFVMELVLGTSITAYCDQHKLTIRDRLALFVEVCHAVHHAHQRGVIHRDLKPSNVMVTQHEDQPQVKIIDFGIAKAVDHHSLNVGSMQTTEGRLLGTPLYMSPEQVCAKADLDTRSDVYSLGVLLYELLVGLPPFDAQRLDVLGLCEALRLLRDELPLRPSKRLTELPAKLQEWIAVQRATSARELMRQLQVDLDWIVMRAIEKAREQRYPSAEALAADVLRMLKHEAIIARPPSKVYQFRKFAQRNRLVLGSVALIILALVGGMSVAVWQWDVADKARQRSEEREQFAQHETRRAIQAERKLEIELEHSEDLLYATQIHNASVLWQSGDVEQTQLLLKRWLPAAGKKDRRELAWRCLTQFLRLPGRELMRLQGPSTDGVSLTSDVSCVRFSPDFRQVVAATDGGVIRRYDMRDERELSPWETGLKDVRRLAFNPDGRFLATTSYEAETVVLETQTGQVRWRWKPMSKSIGAATVEFADKTTLLQSGLGSVIAVWNVERGELMQHWTLAQDRTVIDLAVCPDSPRLAVLLSQQGRVSKTIHLYEQPGGELLHEPLEVLPTAVELTLNRQGNLLAYGTLNGQVEIWTCHPAYKQFEVYCSESITDLQFSADDQHLAATERTGAAHLWRWQDPSSPRLHYCGVISRLEVISESQVKIYTPTRLPFSIPLETHQMAALITAAATGTSCEILLEQSGKTRILVAVNDDKVASQSAVQQETGGLLANHYGGHMHWLAHARPARSLAFTPEGKSVITAGFDGRIMSWNVEHAVPLTVPGNKHQGWLHDLAVMGHTFNFRLYDTRKGACLLDCSVPERRYLHRLSCDPAGRWIAFTSVYGPIWVYDHQRPERLATLDDSAWQETLRYGDLHFWPARSWLITVNDQLPSNTSHMICWDLASRCRVWESLQPTIWRASALDVHNGILYLITDRAILSYGAKGGEPVAQIPYNGRDVRCAAVSPDGGLLALGTNDRYVHLLELPSGQRREKLLRHGSLLVKLQFTPDGATLLALEKHGKLRLWHVASGTQLLGWPSPKLIESFCLSTDGNWLALNFVEYNEIYPIAPLLHLK